MVDAVRIQSEFGDREAIREIIYRYCRAVDRCDFELLAELYWPDAFEDHEPFVGPASEVIDFAAKTMPTFDQTSHFVGNILIEITGERAFVETFFRGHHRVPRPDGSRFDLVSAGRYVDVMERRGNDWRILRRKVVRDWFREYPDSADWEAGLFGIPFTPGIRFPDDPSYAIQRSVRQQGVSENSSIQTISASAR